MQLTSTDLRQLYQAHPDLVLVILMAARITTVPFMVLESSRSLAQQRLNVAKGVSQTMNSRHLVSKDGLVRAVDITPIGPDGKPSYAWPLYFPIADAIKKVTTTLNQPLEWGGVWDRDVRKLGANMEAEVAAYVMRRKAKGRKAFIDGPHWQLPWKDYP